MSGLELFGAAVLYVIGVLIVSLVLTWAVQKRKDVQQMEIGALAVMNFTLLGTWIVGGVVGLVLLGWMAAS